jgi:serine/threonine-protein kinase
MRIETAESLVEALRGSGLFAPDDLVALAAELAPFGPDAQGALRYLVEQDRVPLYQLRKLIHGKAAELVVGPFVVLDKLGEGGMGKVYRARDTRSDRVVALKVVRPHLLANPVVRGRYEREVHTALSLDHPNIAGAVDAGEAGGRYYLALEFVDGIDLSRLVRRYGLLSVPEACEYVRQAALGLHYAHDRGFVHRDIKPSNLVVSGERHVPGATEPARVKVLDMGLVRSVGFDDGGGSPDLTRAGTVVGTPDYMAPEQAKNSSTVDHRADLYSLGGTVYFLLTGRAPFPDGSPIEKVLKHQLDPPPPLQAARPDVPDELARVVARLMAKKPADRFDTAGELAEALRPLTVLTPDSEVVRVAPARRPPPAPTSGADLLSSETLPPSQPAFAPEPPADPFAGMKPVGPSDRTPRPADRPRKRKQVRRAATVVRRDPDPVRHPGRRNLLAAAAVAVVTALLTAAGVWLAFGR